MDLNSEIYSYIEEFNRGGLKFPQDIVCNLIVMAYQIFQVLIGPEYEDLFVGCGAQKKLFIGPLSDTIQIDVNSYL